jgi:hypothetical protein
MFISSLPSMSQFGLKRASPFVPKNPKGDDEMTAQIGLKTTLTYEAAQ